MIKDFDNSLLPPKNFQIMNYTETNFKAIGLDHLNFFRNNLNLTPGSNVLEIGSGNGRIASAFARYLDEGGYTGLEIMKPFVKWCQNTYKKYPNFKFEHINIYNKYYNKLAWKKAHKYKFKFPDNHFDFVLLVSVFTHMQTNEVDNYLSEISRMLKPGGTVFATYFLIDEKTKNLMKQKKSRRKFVNIDEHLYTDNPRVPESAIAYDEAFITSMYSNNGLVTGSDGVQHGKWRNPDADGAPSHNQDRIIATKPEK